MDKMTDAFKLGKMREEADISLDGLNRVVPSVKICPNCKVRLKMTTGGEFYCPRCNFMPLDYEKKEKEIS
jgi:tRNA(Ile2) C34 agmatinyltransferase TiaS